MIADDAWRADNIAFICFTGDAFLANDCLHTRLRAGALLYHHLPLPPAGITSGSTTLCLQRKAYSVLARMACSAGGDNGASAWQRSVVRLAYGRHGAPASHII